MNKGQLLPYISTNNNQFWINTTDLKNIDSCFIQHGIGDIDDVFDYIRARPEDLNIFNVFFKNNYLLNDEYLVSFTNAIVLTNYRLFIWFSDLKAIVPLNSIIKYEDSKWDTGVKVEYYLNGNIQKFSLRTTWMFPEIVNNARNRHKPLNLKEEETIIISNFKPTLQSLYSLETINDNSPAIQAQIPSTIAQTQNEVYHQRQPTQKRQINYRGLAAIMLIVSMFGGCYYFISSNDTPIDYDAMEQRNKTNHVGEVKCDWCGGVGNVGYAGASEAQVRRTGMGLGNKCISCSGTGYKKKE